MDTGPWPEAASGGRSSVSPCLFPAPSSRPKPMAHRQPLCGLLTPQLTPLFLLHPSSHSLICDPQGELAWILPNLVRVWQEGRRGLGELEKGDWRLPGAGGVVERMMLQEEGRADAKQGGASNW